MMTVAILPFADNGLAVKMTILGSFLFIVAILPFADNGLAEMKKKHIK